MAESLVRTKSWQTTHTDVLFLHIARGILHETSDLEVGETQTLCLFQDISRQLLDLVVLFQDSHIIDDILQFVQEPGVNLGQLIDALHAVTLHQSLRHSEEDKQRLKRQLTQNAAHELKTPAASIHGYLESILDHPDMSEDTRQHFLIRCYAQSQRMNKLLLDMAQLTKLDECPTLTSQHHKRTLIDVVPIVHSVIDDLSLQLEEKHITCKLNLPTHIIIESSLTQPEDTIYSIFRNLTDNALAYAAGATQITITYAQGTFFSVATEP